MDDVGLDLAASNGEDQPAERRSHRGRRPRGLPGCLAVLVALVVLVGGFWFAVDRGADLLRAQFGDPDDFSGPGSGSVLVEVEKGDSVAAIGRTLVEEGVVASVGAFTAAAQGNPDASAIQPGHYQLKERMAAEDALAVLVDPENMVHTSVTIPEGFTVQQIAARLAEETEYSKRRFTRLLDRPKRLGLPKYAETGAEGYLFPATYAYGPDTGPRRMLRRMVQEFKQVAATVPLSDADTVGLTKHELVTVASIIAKEVSRPEDMPAVAEVIYNRLDGSCSDAGVPDGLLQMDSTVHYLSGGGTGSVFTDEEARNSDSPYNTYRSTGLPPGPIASPGKAAMEAALAPTDEGYCYFVAVNLETGETAFASTQAEHAENRSRLADWCREHEGRC